MFVMYFPIKACKMKPPPPASLIGAIFGVPVHEKIVKNSLNFTPTEFPFPKDASYQFCSNRLSGFGEKVI